MQASNERDIFPIAVAALLHDIGKFAQRAGRKDLFKTEMEGQILPQDKSSGQYSHLHALYTYGFLEDCLKESLGSETYAGKIAHLAAYHHNPSSEEDNFITLGDWAASGLDRIKQKQERIEQKFYETPICSVLSLITLPEREAIHQHYLGLGKLDDDDTQLKEKLTQEDYSVLWDQFLIDWKRLPISTNTFQYLVNLDSILERWTSLIPSATYKTEPDVSLYDHSRVTAAFSVCAYAYHAEKKDYSEVSIFNVADKKWLFVYGDVQGIQKHIFNLKKNDKSSKLLRARSFQIEALCKSAAHSLIVRSGVVPQCEIMNGGGNFMLLLPNTEKVRTAVENYEKEINGFLLCEYLGTLSLNITLGAEVSLQDLTQENTPELLQTIHAANYKGKQKRFQSVLDTQGHYIDHYYEAAREAIGEGNLVCMLCDYRPAQIDRKDDEAICSHCDALISLGTRLPKAHAVVLETLDPAEDNAQKKSASFGFFPVVGQLEGSGIQYCINGYGTGSFMAFHPAPYHVPIAIDKNGEPRVLMFEEIAKKATGTKKLAMFKADVDNLGTIFREGLGPKVSLSKYASLSRQMHYFFSVKLNKWIQEQKDYAESIYTVYSGGDDICVLGPWNVIFDFARDIQAQFASFSFHNPSLTLSAGIALADSNMPIPILAEEAERQLERAKAQQGKNSLCVFSIPVSWQEFDLLYNNGKRYADYLGRQELPVSLFRKLLDLSNRAWSMLVEGDISSTNTLWLSQLKYTISRYREMKSCRVAAQFWDNLLAELTSNHYQMMWKSKISVCYALYSIRSITTKI